MRFPLKGPAAAISCAIALTFGAPAQAAISAPTLLTASFNTTATSSNPTASVTAPANSFVFVAFRGSSSVTALTCSNSGVDTWTTATLQSGGGGKVTICYTYSAGFTGAITLSTGAVNSAANWVVGYATNSASSSQLDKTTTLGTNAGNVTSVSPNVTFSGAIAQADELLIALTAISQTSGTVSENTTGGDTFIALTDDQASSGGVNLHVSYEVAAAATNYSYGVSWVNAHPYSAMMWSIKGLPAAAPFAGAPLLGIIQ